MNKGRVYIISGPSGTGKDTLMKKIFEKLPELAFSISSVTRPIRPGEIPGQKYNYISLEQFEKMLAENEFLEHNLYVGNYYGTPKTPVINCIEKGQDILIEVDVNGALQIREKMPDVVSIFILPPSLEELKRRLTGRGTDSPEVIEKRLNEALREIEGSVDYDYVVVNDNLEIAVDDFINIISVDKCKTELNLGLINKILNK